MTVTTETVLKFIDEHGRMPTDEEWDKLFARDKRRPKELTYELDESEEDLHYVQAA